MAYKKSVIIKCRIKMVYKKIRIKMVQQIRIKNREIQKIIDPQNSRETEKIVVHVKQPVLYILKFSKQSFLRKIRNSLEIPEKLRLQ